jgi:3-isopropylmalate/(R)-2-methylmalate dehydratase small subunit
MESFTRLTAVACPLALANVDTDQIVPARFMSTPRSQGYGGFLLHDLRRGADGKPTGSIALDRPERAGARIVVARRNFGCGSSREAAVYALMDFGIRCVIAPSFGEIFAGNALSNGLLAARVSEAEADALIAALEAGARELTVDLEGQSISGAGVCGLRFDIDPAARVRLLNGWDAIDMTLSLKDRIAAFQARDATVRPWAIPVGQKR